MNTHAKNDTPNRPLSDNFTDITMRRSQIAKNRSMKKQSLGVFLAMKTRLFSFRTVGGAGLSVTIIAISAVSVYALTNWFGGDPIVKQDASILHVDLSSCKGNLPPGIEPTANRNDVQFKITGSPHISADDLQRQLLIDCESNAVNEFYNPAQSHIYGTTPATILSIQGQTITISYQWAGKTQTKTFAISAANPLYAYGQPAQLRDFHPGDFVIVATPVSSAYVLEGTDTFATASVYSMFKTQYDLSNASGSSKTSGIMYQTDNIMPLDLYNQTHRN